MVIEQFESALINTVTPIYGLRHSGGLTRLNLIVT